ncbi:MAG: hypothetical protein ABSF57_01490 [Acidobacteriaceae bacterium]
MGTALLCVYVLPFCFPPLRPAISQSYVVGYNNKVASVSLALISVLVALLSLHRNGVAPRDFKREPTVSWPWLVGALLLVAAWNGGLSWFGYTAHGYGIEDFYILPQLEKFYYLHRHLYRDIEFCYGQLLFYPPVWIHWVLTPFHVSLRASYYIAFLFHHLLGVGMLYFVVNRMPMPRVLRVAAFTCIALFSFNLTLGPNYALLRFILPLFLFVLFSRIQRPVAAAAAAVVAQILTWLDSPEQAIAFGFAVVVYCCYQWWRQRNPLWMAPIAGVVAGAGFYFAFTDPNVLSALIHISSGWGNLVPLPSLEVVTLLVATVWLVPRLVARHLSQETPQSGLLLGLYALGLGLLPASLGGCNIVHIAGNSAVLFLLSLVAVAEWKLPMRALWTVAVIATYLLLFTRWYSVVHRRFYPNIACIDENVTPLAARLPARLAARLPAFEQKWPCYSQPLDVAALHAAIGDAPFATPYRMPEIVEEELPQVPNFVPSYWSGTIDLWDAETEQKKVDELRQVQWALLWGPPGVAPVEPNSYGRFAITTHYRAIHPSDWDGLVANEIYQNWELTGRIGIYLLYHRVR